MEEISKVSYCMQCNIKDNEKDQKSQEMRYLPEAQNNNRIAWVDALKFLGIFAIYVGHFGDSAGKLYLYVFTFHVQLFFFVSGFLPYPKRK